MLDYHVHLWSHDDSTVDYQLDQVAAYCEEAARHGVHEIALTEHLYRFVELRAAVGDFWTKWSHEPTSALMAEYFDFHSRNSLDAYIDFASRAKDAGLPVKVGLEVDYYRGQMDVVADLLAGYPLDVAIGSVHWIDTWQFDDIDTPAQMALWESGDVDLAWSRYTELFEELAATRCVDVLAHPDVIKVAGYVATDPGPLWDRMTAAAAAAGVSVECSSAGWFKPVAEQYPADGFLDRLVAGGVTFTTASDAHRLARVGARASDLADLLEVRGIHELASYEQRQRVTVPLRRVS